MKPLEDELRRGLRRMDPPAGFTDRVMARVERGTVRKPKASWRSLFPAWAGPTAMWRLAAVAAVVALLVSGVLWREHRIREEQRQGELARAQVMQALRVTSVKLHRVRTRVREATGDEVRSTGRGKANSTSRLQHHGLVARDWDSRARADLSARA